MNNFNNFLSHLNLFDNKQQPNPGLWVNGCRMPVQEGKGTMDKEKVIDPMGSGLDGGPASTTGAAARARDYSKFIGNQTPIQKNPKNPPEIKKLLAGMLYNPEMPKYPGQMEPQRIEETDTSYDDVESSRIRAMDQNTTSLPENDETVQNLDKAWDYRNSWFAKGKIKDAWSKMSPREQQQARNYAKSKGRDFSEMNSALNETSNHNIFLNYLNSFFK